jgi:hypothetical protein
LGVDSSSAQIPTATITGFRRKMNAKMPRSRTKLTAFVPHSDPRLEPIETARMRKVQTKELVMSEKIIRIALNEKLTNAAHWAVFSIGALALTFSIAATAASAL